MLSRRVDHVTISGDRGTGKTEAAFGYALLAAKHGRAVLYVTDDHAEAEQLQRELPLDAGPIDFVPISTVHLEGTTKPYRTIVVDARPGPYAWNRIRDLVDRAAALHGHAHLVTTQDTLTL